MQMCADEIARYLKRIAELEKELEDWQDGTIIAQWQDYEQKVKELEKQLAESEEENETFRKALRGEIFINYKIPMENERLKQELAEKDKLINEYADYLARSQWKIADLVVKEIKAENFAIDILEELDGSSNYINSKLDFECGFYISQKTIRDKIKELKGEKK